MIGTLAIDGWAVTFGTVRRGLGWLWPHLVLATSNLVHNLGLGLAYQKQRFGPNLARVWVRGASKKFGTPYLFLQPLKLATEKLVHNMSSG